MNYCKTCKWWFFKLKEYQGFGKEIVQPEDPDTFEPMQMPFRVSFCNSPILLFHERPAESSGAALIDGSEYYAALITGEDFGCVNYEAKE